jgi:hypothetical protein
MSVKEQVLRRKIEKKRKAALRFLNTQGGIDNYFHYVENRPTTEQFLDMATVAFYGPVLQDSNIYDPIGAGGKEFFVEYFLDALVRVKNNYNKGLRINSISLTEEGVSEALLLTTQSEYWLNMGVMFVFDLNIIEHVDKLNPSDFDCVDNYYFVERDTQAVALRVLVTRSQVGVHKLFSWFGEEKGWDIAQNLKPEWLTSPFKREGFATEYIVLFTTPDRVDKFEEYERQKHNVKSHERHLKSGKVVDIRAHIRTNPLKTLKSALNTEEVDYIVYRVNDADGILRYYGEGKESRPMHVNSGVSHNFKINEHFFLQGKMEVEVIKQHLSKQEALFIEKMFIRNHTASKLWNIKDYEPFVGLEGDPG